MTEKRAGMSSMPKEVKKSQSPAEPERAAVRRLVKAAREHGEDLSGLGGLLKTLTKTVLGDGPG